MKKPPERRGARTLEAIDPAEGAKFNWAHHDAVEAGEMPPTLYLGYDGAVMPTKPAPK